MAQIISKEELQLNFKEFLQKIEDGAIFIYPTDTIYGIGCNALHEEAVKKIRALKNRSKTPFSVIAPSVAWIKENTVVTPQAESWLEKLPGPYTLILKKQKQDCVAPSVTQDLDSVGVRIPDHWMHQVIETLGIPVVTTSVNKTGAAFMTKIDDLDPDIKTGINFIIDEGEKKACPSNIVFLNKEEMEMKDRSKP